MTALLYVIHVVDRNSAIIVIVRKPDTQRFD
jgi:hypothetical protein